MPTPPRPASRPVAQSAVRPAARPVATAPARPAPAPARAAQAAQAAVQPKPAARPASAPARTATVSRAVQPAKPDSRYAENHAEEVDPETGEDETVEQDSAPGEVYDDAEAGNGEVTYAEEFPDDGDIPQSSDDDKIINMSEIEEGGDFQLLPKGNYPFIVDESEFKIAKTGSTMIKLTLEVREGDHAKQKAWTNIVLTEKNLPRVKRDLRLLGVSMPQDGMTMRQLKLWLRNLADQGTLLGAEGYMQIAHREYEGTTRSEVKRLLPSQNDLATGGDGFLDG